MVPPTLHGLAALHAPANFAACVICSHHRDAPDGVLLEETCQHPACTLSSALTQCLASDPVELLAALNACQSHHRFGPVASERARANDICAALDVWERRRACKK